jgi:hypothetical protein
MPPALIAATPVGATTASFFFASRFICCKSVVLPVPALPVRKTVVLVDAMYSRANAALVFTPQFTHFGLFSRSKLQFLHLFYHSKYHHKQPVCGLQFIICLVHYRMQFSIFHQLSSFLRYPHAVFCFPHSRQIRDTRYDCIIRIIRMANSKPCFKLKNDKISQR